MRAATIKKFDIKVNTQLEHIDHDRLPRSNRQCRERKKSNTRMNEGEMCDEVVPVIANDRESMEAMTAAELTEIPGLLYLRRSNPSKLILNTSMSANHIPSRDRCESREVE